MTQHIHCIVQDCQYYGEGNICLANEILVATEQYGNTQTQNINAEMASELTPQKAGSSMSTICKTYLPKDSKDSTDHIRLDEINIMP